MTDDLVALARDGSHAARMAMEGVEELMFDDETTLITAARAFDHAAARLATTASKLRRMAEAPRVEPLALALAEAEMGDYSAADHRRAAERIVGDLGGGA